MTSTTGKYRDVIIGVVVTDRSASMRRLLASLAPLDADLNVHVVALDNGAQPSEIPYLMSEANERAKGRRHYVQNPRPWAPLHETRVQLSRRIANLTDKWAIREPIVWMIDDDLTFERFRLVKGQLECRNISRQRINQVRILAAADRCDLLVSGFTGDPPVRPNAVISGQLSDLCAELNRFAGAPPDASFHGAPVEPPRYCGDYYYSHSEHTGPQWRKPYPWLMRPEAGETVTDQLVQMFEEARSIEIGRGVFRPLVEETASSELELVDSVAPNRGGNAVFFGLAPLLAHRYPAFPVGNGYSRRSDMIGSAILAREHGYRIAEGHLSLRHDRRNQSPISAHPREWKREFAGVMLARMVMHGVPPGLSAQHYLKRIARKRTERIRNDASQVTAGAQRALSILDRPAAWWWKDNRCRPSADALRDSLARIRQTFERAHLRRIFDGLLSEDFLQQVLRAYTSLQPARSFA